MIHFYSGDARPDMVKIKRVVIAPHADDEILGCGGLLAKFPDETAVVVMVQPDDVRIKEFEAAKRILGYHSAHVWDLPDGYLGADPRRATQILDNVVDALQPEEMYLPYPSMHQDHMDAYAAGIRASRLSMGSRHWYTRNIYAYDVGAYDLDVYATKLNWNVFLALTEPQIDKKVSAMQMYGSQMVDGPHPANGLKETAAVIGASHQTNWAEKYALIRGVCK
jgi:LmbE family N-acetylglucosaminyl deacetylase